MFVSTAALILKVVQKDKALLKTVVKHGKSGAGEDRRDSFNLLGSMLALSFAGPFIAKLIEHTFDVAFFGDPDSDDPAKKRGLIGSAWDSIKNGSSELIDSLMGKGTSTPASDSATVTPAPVVNTGAKVKANADSSLGSPTEQIDNALRAAALREKISYGLMYAIAGAESTFSATASAGTSSAQGLFQFTTSTWKYLTEKMYPDLGYKMGDRNDPNKSSIVAAKYIGSIQESLTSFLGKVPTTGQIYLGYFMGPTGARKFLGALSKNASQLGARLFPNQAKANKNLFYENGQPLTLQGTLDKLEGKVGKYFAQADTEGTQVKVAKVTPNNSGAGSGDNVTPVGQGAQVASAVSPATTLPVPKVQAQASQVAQIVSPTELPTASKVSRIAQVENMDVSPTMLPMGQTPQPEKTYVRDRQGRITALQG